jgi:hypothetical protein
MAAPRTDEKVSEIHREKPTSQSAQDSKRAMSDATDRIARTAADVSERTSKIGIEVVKRSAETAKQVWEASSEAAARLTERSANQFGRVLGFSGEDAQKTIQGSSQQFEALMQSGGVVASASQDISREWVEMARGIMEATIDRSETFARCRTPQDVFAMQLELASDNIKTLLQGTRRMSVLSERAAQDAVTKISETARQTA